MRAFKPKIRTLALREEQHMKKFYGMFPLENLLQARTLCQFCVLETFSWWLHCSALEGDGERGITQCCFGLEWV